MQEEELENKGLENVSEVLTETVEQEPNPDKQKESYEKYLELEDEVAKNLTEVEQAPSVNEDFDVLPDDELEKLYDQYLKIEEEKRTEEQNALLEQTKERYLKIKFYRELEETALWFENEYPDKDFRSIVNESDFHEFARGIKLPIRELVRRYMIMEQKFENQKYHGAGSVVSNGATVGKDYFSLAEVRKMSKEEVAKNLETIKKSMTKWK